MRENNFHHTDRELSLDDLGLQLRARLALGHAFRCRLDDSVVSAIRRELGMADRAGVPGALDGLSQRSLVTCFGRTADGEPFQRFVPPSRIAEAIGRGHTVVVEDGRQISPTITAVASALRDDVGYAPDVGAVALSISPPGEAVPLHFDGLETFALQLSGHKRWRVGKAVEVLHPSTSMFYAERTTGYRDNDRPAPAYVPSALPSAARLLAQDLGPGHGMALCRGWWHETSVPHDGRTSVGLVFKMPTVSLSRHLGTWVNEQLVQCSRFRTPLLGMWSTDPDARREAEEDFSRAREEAVEYLGSVAVVPARRDEL
jgi:hypothetical protein